MSDFRQKPRMGKRKRAILEMLQSEQPCTTAAIVEKMGVHASVISISLRKLKAEGHVQAIGRGMWALKNYEAEEFVELPSQTQRGTGNVDLQAVREHLVRWLAQYTGPSNDRIAVGVVMAKMHLDDVVETARVRVNPVSEEINHEANP